MPPLSAETRSFLNAMFINCESGDVEFRFLPEVERFFVSLTAIDNGVPTFPKNKNAYVGVATKAGGGTKEHILEIPSVWMDYDFKTSSREQFDARLKDFPFKPSILVETGGGLHPQWILNEPASKQDIPRVEEVNRRIVDYFGGDPQAVDAARILRLPGTVNVKYSPPRPVNLIYADAKQTYNLSELEEVIPPVPPLKTNKSLIGDLSRGLSNPDSKFMPSHTKSQIVTPSHKLDWRDGHRDESLFHVANCLVKGGMEIQNIEQVLGTIANSCQPPFPEREQKTKIKSAMERAARRERNIAQEIRKWVQVTEGHFLVTDCHRESHIVTKEEKHAVIVSLKRLCQEGIIEKYGDKRGSYRRVDSELEVINWRDAPREEYPVRLPFGLNELVRIYPGNIVVVAGEINAGKTAILMNITKDNMQNRDVWYFSSEMKAPEFLERIECFAPETPPDRWKFQAIHRPSNFSDVIQPNSLNIIDYLEIHDNFYVVGGMIKGIYDKLQGGIAIIGLQKNPGTKMGLGGSRSAEKARLYINIEEDRPAGNLVTIVKAKSWRPGTGNPNGKQLRYKLHKGAKIDPQTSWDYPMEREIHHGATR